MRKTLAATLVTALLLTACAGGFATKPAAQTSDLEARITTLEQQLAMLTAASEAPETEEKVAGTEAAFQVAVAQYVMDTSGFHSMDDSLNETQTIDPSYLSTVNRVIKVVTAAPWPEALHEQSGSFVTLLEEFAAALDADNGADAAALAAEVHDVQHDFSHAIDNWLGEGHGHGD